jgi:hypothetical protein
MAANFKSLWTWLRGWLEKNFTWKGLVVGVFVLYQIVPDTSGRNAYWLSMYPAIKDFIFNHSRIFLIGLGVLLIWLDHRSVLAKHRPLVAGESGLKLTLADILHLYDKNLDIMVFVLSAYLINRGEPTIAKDWYAEYEIGDSKEVMKSFYLMSDYAITIRDETIVIESKNLIQSQVLTNRLEKGEAKHGRIIFTLPGNRTDQVKALRFKIRVECSDYADRKTSAMFIPDPTPLNGMKMYPGERLTKVVKKSEIDIPPNQPLLTAEVDKKE